MIFKSQNKYQDLRKSNSFIPPFPRPFIFRVEINKDFDKTGKIISAILPSSSFLVFEVSDGLQPQLLEWLNSLDRRPTDLSFSLLARNPGDLSGQVLLALRHLRRFNELEIIVGASEIEKGSDKIIKALKLVEQSALRTKAVLEIGNEVETGNLKDFLTRLFSQTSTAVALRRAEREKLNLANKWEELVSSYLSNLLPLSFEECFPEINPGLWLESISCRGGFGSGYVTAEGVLKPCRLSDLALGNLLEKDLETIWADFLKIRDSSALCPLKVYEKRRQTINAPPPNRPFVLESGLKPVPLFRIRQEKCGATLIKGLDGLMLTEKGLKIIKEVNGNRTLKALKKKFGKEAVSLIFALFLQGFVRLEK
ncbi:MAG: hypothetical protein H5U06_06630 [Candidatus Aminicenantes bacterium]|nr:hypothetical protein [Candidatus Aminicenantes bacterium]